MHAIMLYILGYVRGMCVHVCVCLTSLHNYIAMNVNVCKYFVGL